MNRQQDNNEGQASPDNNEIGMIKIRRKVRILQDAVRGEGQIYRLAYSLTSALKSWLQRHGAALPTADELGIVATEARDNADAWRQALASIDDKYRVGAALVAYVMDLRHKRGIMNFGIQHKAVIQVLLEKFAGLIGVSHTEERRKHFEDPRQLELRNMIRALKDKAKVSQSELARLLETSPNTVSRWLTGINAVSSANAARIRRLYEERVQRPAADTGTTNGSSEGEGINDQRLLAQIRSAVKRNPTLKLDILIILEG